MTLLSVLIDWIHLFAAAAWIGGLVFINFVYNPVVDAAPPQERGKMNAIMAEKFAKVAWGSVILLIITGIYNIPEGAFDNADYRNAFSFKMVLVLAMIAVGAYMGFKLGPSLPKLAPKPGEKPSTEFINAGKLMRKLGFINMILGILLLFFAGSLLNNADLTI